MLLINGLTDNAVQQFTLIGIPDLSIDCTLTFLPRINRWKLDINTTDNSGNAFTLNGLAVATSVNMLQQYVNTIPFGIACIRADGLDPFQITDFSNAVANLYLLDSTDIATITEDWFTGPLT